MRVNADVLRLVNRRPQHWPLHRGRPGEHRVAALYLPVETGKHFVISGVAQGAGENRLAILEVGKALKLGEMNVEFFLELRRHVMAEDR